MGPKQLLRYALAVLLVVIPASYVLFEGRYAHDPIAEGLSYQSVNEQLSSTKDPAFWTFAIWVVAVFIVLTLGVKLVDWLLLKVFPNVPQR